MFFVRIYMLERYAAMNRGALKNTIFHIQARLWEIETKLNLPLEQRVLLEKGWAQLGNEELITLSSKINDGLMRRSEELAQMEAEYGKADDIRKEIEAVVGEYEALCKEVKVVPTFLFPKGFRFMNAKELQNLLKIARECRELANQRLLERQVAVLRKQEAIEREKQAEIRREESSAGMQKINALRDSRLRLINEIATPLVALQNAIKMDRNLGIAVPKINLPLRTSLMLGLMKDEDFNLLAAQHRRDIESAIRAMREPLRRAHQSAQARGATKVDFKAYLQQLGYDQLLK